MTPDQLNELFKRVIRTASDNEWDDFKGQVLVHEIRPELRDTVIALMAEVFHAGFVAGAVWGKEFNEEKVVLNATRQ